MVDFAFLTPRQFATRVNLTLAHVGVLLRRGEIADARQLASGRWRIPDYAVERFLAGDRPQPLMTACTTEEFARRLWQRYGQGRMPAWLDNTSS